jgi:hypothetical protein
VRMGVGRRSRIFSSSLDRNGKRLIGLYEVTSDGFFPGLTIIIICPIFQYLGKYSTRRIALYICVRARIPFGDSSLSTVPVIKSYPGAFVGFVLCCMICLTSLIRIFCSGGAIGCGELCSCKIYYSSSGVVCEEKKKKTVRR